MTYIHKIGTLSKTEITATSLYQKLDSLKQTRRPTDSKIELYFNRDIDFGYKHQRFNITLNGLYFQVNLLTKKDTIYLSSVKCDDSFYSNPFPNLEEFKIDTNRTLKYLKLHNQFYGSSKTLKDLKSDLNINEEYAKECGDGLQKTQNWKSLEKLAKNKDVVKLKILLQSVCCEEQAYGVAGFKMIEKKGLKISSTNQKLIKHIEQRNSDIIVCNGCFLAVEKPKKSN